MDLYTNMPGLQFYSGNNLNGSTIGKGAYPYPVYGGMALETQVSYICRLERYTSMAEWGFTSSIKCVDTDTLPIRWL